MFQTTNQVMILQRCWDCDLTIVVMRTMPMTIINDGFAYVVFSEHGFRSNAV